MDFHWWMLLPLLPLGLASFFVYKVWRIRRRARTFLALSRAERLVFARAILRDPEAPIGPRVLVALAAAYLALPFDLIPDFIPVIGHADDFFVATAMLAVIHRAMPAERVVAAMRAAREGGRPETREPRVRRSSVS